MAASMLSRVFIFTRPLRIKTTHRHGIIKYPICRTFIISSHHRGQYNSVAPVVDIRSKIKEQGKYHELELYGEPLKPMSATKFHHDLLCAQHPDQPENAEVLKVAVIGTPNCGKSTLTNQLMGRWVSSVSSKAHTTRQRTTAILTENNTQIIFLDTPGMVNVRKAKRHQLGRSMVVDPRNVFEEADIVMVLVDVSNKWTRFKLDSDIIMTLNSYPNVKSLLVLNKIDTVQKKNLLLSITAQLTEGIVNGKSFEIDAVIAKRLGSVESGSSMKADYVSVMHKMINRLEKDRKRKLELEKISQSGIDKRRIEAIVEQWKKRQELQDSDGQPNEVISHDKSTEIKDLWMQNFSTKKTNQMSPSVDSKLNRGEDMVGYESQGLFTGEAVLEDKTQKQASVIVKSGDRLSESHENVRDTEHSNMGGEMFDENTDCKLHDSFADESVDCKDANDFQGVEAILRHSDLSDDVLRSKGLSDKDLKWIKHQLKLEQKRRTKKQLLRKTGWPNFDGVFMISALFNDGIDDLQDYLFTQARPGEWEYHPDLFTDQGPETVIYEIVRSKLLEYLPEEVPYQLEQSTELLEKGENNELQIVQKIICRKRSHTRMLIGTKGKRVIQISAEAAEDLMNAFQCNVKLYLDVKLKK